MYFKGLLLMIWGCGSIVCAPPALVRLTFFFGLSLCIRGLSTLCHFVASGMSMALDHDYDTT